MNEIMTNNIVEKHADCEYIEMFPVTRLERDKNRDWR